ncbi:hypothetical protein Vretifemale_2215 [Volvox reticuliferus]|nr:hypothetical protein Vretifemale_2215 [Volvox reticuliferus]
MRPALRLCLFRLGQDPIQDSKCAVWFRWFAFPVPQALVVERQMEDSAVQQYLSTVMATEEELKVSRMQGPGLASLEYLLARRRFSDAGWVVGEGPSVADFAVFDLVDLHLVQGQLAKPLRNRFPALEAHHTRVAELPGETSSLRRERRLDGW